MTRRRILFASLTSRVLYKTLRTCHLAWRFKFFRIVKKRSTSYDVLLFLVTRRRIELLLPPWKGGVLAAWPTGLVAEVGLEPTTIRVWTERSSQLSYSATSALILYHISIVMSILFWNIFSIFYYFFACVWFHNTFYDIYLINDVDVIFKS